MPVRRGIIHENWQLGEKFPHYGSPKNHKESPLPLGKIQFSHEKNNSVLLVQVNMKSTSQPRDRN